MTVELRRFAGAAAQTYVPDLARLRIEVFREFPYLYDGEYDYESNYLNTYLDVRDSVIVVAFDGPRVVGASTGLPMAAEADNVTRPFVEHRYDLDRIFYFGESVLQRAYRGQGLGVRFFEEREAHARALHRFELATFCAVLRPDNHSRRPADYVPLDDFWNKRGYQQHPELRTTFSWRDLDEASESPKPMVYWLKRFT